jgi:glycosyltransferase involved in cell wall biosynthesis
MENARQVTSASPAAETGWQVPAYDTVFWLGKRHAYCVVIPVVNEGERIRNFLRRLEAVNVSKMADLIIVDGGSTDGSLDRELLAALGVRCLIVKTGAGRLSAQLRCAYAFALRKDYEGIVTIDGNDKDDPEAISRFLEALRDGVDFVQASRFVPGGITENTPRMRELAIRLVHAPLLRFCSGFGWTDTTQGFRAYSSRMLIDPRLAIFRDVFANYELLAYLSCRAPQLGYQCIELPTARRYPATGAVPTKISGLRGNLQIFLTLIRVCLGSYNP